MRELRNEPEDWRNYLRMDSYLKLLSAVTPLIKIKNTIMSKAISHYKKLNTTLRFLATGRTYRDLEYTTAISKQSLSCIVPKTCRAIYKVLRRKYLTVSK